MKDKCQPAALENRHHHHLAIHPDAIDDRPTLSTRIRRHDSRRAGGPQEGLRLHGMQDTDSGRTMTVSTMQCGETSAAAMGIDVTTGCRHVDASMLELYTSSICCGFVIQELYNKSTTKRFFLSCNRRQERLSPVTVSRTGKSVQCKCNGPNTGEKHILHHHAN